MTIRFVTARVHAWLDYPVAASLLATPFLLGIGAADPLARYFSVATGVAALLLTLLTDHDTGLVRVVPYWVHVAVDRLVGVNFLIAPFLFGFRGLDAAYYLINGLAVLLVTVVFAAPMPVPPRAVAQPA